MFCSWRRRALWLITFDAEKTTRKRSSTHQTGGLQFENSAPINERSDIAADRRQNRSFSRRRRRRVSLPRNKKKAQPRRRLVVADWKLVLISFKNLNGREKRTSRPKKCTSGSPRKNKTTFRRRRVSRSPFSVKIIVTVLINERSGGTVFFVTTSTLKQQSL